MTRRMSREESIVPISAVLHQRNCQRSTRLCVMGCVSAQIPSVRTSLRGEQTQEKEITRCFVFCI